VDIVSKLNNYLKIACIVNDTFRPQKTGIKLYTMLALPALLCSSENWTIKARDARRITAAGMK